MATGVTVHLTNRSLMLVASFLLLPPHTWPLHTWGRVVVSSCTQPLAMELALSLWDQVMFKVGGFCGSMWTLLLFLACQDTLGPLQQRKVNPVDWKAQQVIMPPNQ